MNYPNLYHLKYFMDAVELGSVSAAAYRNMVSHSAISQAIKSIESNLNIELMVHKKRSFEVTPQGHALALKTKALLGTLHSLPESHPNEDSQLAGRIVVGLSRSLANAYLGPLLAQLQKQFPLVQLEIRMGTTGELLEKSAQNEVDLSLTIGHQPMPTLKQSLLRQGQFVLIEPVVKTKTFLKKFILTEPRYETELLKKNYFQHSRTSLPVYLEIASWDSIAHLVAEGLGFGLVPDIAITADRRKKIKKVPTSWFECSYQIYLNQAKTISKNRDVILAVSELLKKVVS
jgi:LysR family transcriptional regulator, carnitine catabolism transcriptional activator